MRPCPVPDCSDSTALIFCDTHWKSLSSEVRRVIKDELEAQKKRGQHVPSERIKEAITIAWNELKKSAQ